MQTAFLRTALVCCAGALLSACGGAEVAETPAAPATQVVAEACSAESRADARARRPALEEAALAAAQESRGAGAPALWKMSDEDTVVYLFGTVHLLRPDMQWQTPVIEAAIASADTVVFEADVSSPEAQRELMKFYTGQGFFADGTQLTSLLSGTETEELTEALQLVDLPVEALQPYKPWMAAINISVKQMIDEGFDPEAGVEKVIERAALEHGASFAFLETVDDQLGGLAGLGNCEQIDFLMATVDGLEDGTAALDLLVDEWADGDVNGLGALMSNPEMLGSQPIYDAMMTDRNARWVPKIEVMLESPGTVLVAVGAGHLAGEGSVIEMLREKGHVVEGP
ncbi:TraB/GumN family protein [Hyphomonas sp. WL0036]|uniref:TraB/GumN family protein n=1 Tax=Hyphomonas sediminis TaxID=2866160 RepID=UPI001C821540|nr:TraB/GumN family protein [Hyphomonas sediminis]MBY9065792.1 TraB/GumN family protein [Hyphomonas sediminis]